MYEGLKKLCRYFIAYRFYGIYLFIKLYWLKSESVWLKGYGTILLRRNSPSDRAIFTQIFIYKLCDFILHDKIDVIIDLGANNGMTVILFKKMYPAATIYALEPDKENFNMLTKNAKGLDNVFPINKAIWRENKMVGLSSDESWAVKVNEMELGKSVAAITMESLLKEYSIDKIDLLKVDIEGAEIEMFEDASYFMTKTKNIIIELHDWSRKGCAKQFFEAIRNFDYSYSVNNVNTLIKDITVSS